MVQVVAVVLLVKVLGLVDMVDQEFTYSVTQLLIRIMLMH
jgi:hypothetical protein